MHKEILDITDPQLASVNLSSCELLVQCGVDFSGFVLYRSAVKQVYAWALYEELTASPEEMYSIVQQHGWLSHSYQKTLVVHYTAVNMLVPTTFNREAEKELLFELIGDTAPGRLLSKDLVLNQNIMNHYSIQEETALLLNHQFPKAYWWHDQSLLLGKPASAQTKFTLTVWFKTIQITIEENEEWLFLQKFAYKTPEDVLYHVLNTAKQHSINLQNTPVTIEGFVEQNSRLADTLQLYIPNLQWKTELQFQYPASAYQPHLLASLDRILSCVS